MNHVRSIRLVWRSLQENVSGARKPSSGSWRSEIQQLHGHIHCSYPMLRSLVVVSCSFHSWALQWLGIRSVVGGIVGKVELVKKKKKNRADKRKTASSMIFARFWQTWSFASSFSSIPDYNTWTRNHSILQNAVFSIIEVLFVDRALRSMSTSSDITHEVSVGDRLIGMNFFGNYISH